MLIISATNDKKKCEQYSQEYLKYGFVPSFVNETILCACYVKILSAMKPAKMRDPS